MKKRICQVCSICLMLATLFLTGCGGSFFSEEDLQIVSIEAEPTNEGYTRLIITYTDESERDPDIFAIPDGQKGKMGEKGTGIAKISYEHDENNYQTGVTIEFTDNTLQPVSFDIPDGRSVVEISPYDDPSGSKALIFQYSDGTQSDPYIIPKGDDGKDGLGIEEFTWAKNEDKEIVIDITFTDDYKPPMHIQIPQGRGIAAMSAGDTEDGSQYSISVTYNDGTTQTIDFARPSKWFNGTTDPNDPENEVVGSTKGDYFFDTLHYKMYIKDENGWTEIVGFSRWFNGAANPNTLEDEVGIEGNKIGDYFFDTLHDKIYIKEESGWTEIVGFNVEKHRITFDINDEGDASMPVNANTFEVERGTYFSDNGLDIPIPTRPGYTFKGWYRKKVYDPTMSPFTDLTPVFADLTLYAIWEKNP